MAKRKKTKKTVRRRRRVGAVALNPNSALMTYAPIVAGFLLAPQIDKLTAKIIPANVDGKIVAAAEAGLGALLVFGKGKPSVMKKVAGGILLGAGIKRGLTEFGIGGIGGYQMVNALNGYNKVQSIAGAKRINGYVPGNNGMNGYPTTREAINGIPAGMEGDLMDR